METKEGTEKLKRRESRPLSEREINKLIVSCESSRNRIIILLLVNTGIRRKDLSELRVSSFDFGEGFLRIPSQNKTGNMVNMPLEESFQTSLKIYINEQLDDKIGFLFPSAWTDSSISERTINRVVERAVDKANVGNITPHDFRATFLTGAGRRGVNAKITSDALGVSVATVLKYYTKFTPEETVKEFEDKLWKK